MSKFDYVPSSYEDLYNHYFKVTGGKSIAGTLIKGIMPHATADEFESLSQDVFMRMMSNHVLEKFDPAKGNFGGAVFFVTRSVCVNHLDRKARDPMAGLNAGSLVDTREDGEFELGVYSLDAMDEGRDPTAGREATDVVTKLTKRLEQIAAQATNTRDRNLVKVLRLMARELTPAEMAVELGVTKTTISNWTQQIQLIAQQLRLV